MKNRLILSICVLVTISFVLTCCNNPDTADSKAISDHKYPQLVIPIKGSTASQLTARTKKVMISSDHPEATKAGLDILKKGGNIVDAAIAVSFTLSVTCPQSTGIGGGGFMLVHLAKENKTIAFDFRERAPLKAFKTMYLTANGKVDDRASRWGYRSVAVPGMIAGFVQIHRQFGSLPLKQVMKPSITLARDGFKVYNHLAHAIEKAYDNMDDNMKALYAPKGVPLKTGSLLVQRNLAKTLEAVARHGDDVFYRGKIGKALVSQMAAHGGLITKKDLKNYRMYQSKPLISSYRKYKIAIMPPPSSGVHIITILNMLETRDIAAMRKDSSRFTHFFTEVLRRGFADRARYGGDSRFVKVPVKRLSSKSYAKKLVEGITSKASSSNKIAKLQGHEHKSYETTHLSIMDSEGNAVASTQSINYRFGAGVLLPEWGIILNNTMDDFSVAPGVPNLYGLVGGEANAIEGTKTPLSSMSPTIVFSNNKPILAVGASGGSYIITGILQTLINVLDFKLSLYDSVAAGRIHHQYQPDKLFLESEALSAETIKKLKSIGHQIIVSPNRSKVCAVHKDGNDLVGVADPRRGGRPGGF